MANYVIKSGDTIYDAAYNISGSLNAVDELLEQNVDKNAPMANITTVEGELVYPWQYGYETYTPIMIPNALLKADDIDITNQEAVDNGKTSAYSSNYGFRENVDAEMNALDLLLEN